MEVSAQQVVESVALQPVASQDQSSQVEGAHQLQVRPEIMTEGERGDLNLKDRLAKQKDRALSVLSHRDELLKAARAKAAVALREARGVSAPGATPPSVEAQATTQQPKAIPPAKASAPSKAADAELAQMLAAQLQKQSTDAAAALQEASKLKADADAKLAELAKAIENPIEFLASQGMSLDDWQKRLLNGGEETPEAKALRQAKELHGATQKEIADWKAEQAAKERAGHRQAAIQALKPALEQNYPFLNKLVAPEAVLEEMRSIQAKQPNVQIDLEAALQGLEDGLMNTYASVLKDDRIAAKLQQRVPQPPAEKADLGPRTLTNRVTSTTAPRSSGPMSLAEKRQKAAAVWRAMQG